MWIDLNNGRTTCGNQHALSWFLQDYDLWKVTHDYTKDLDPRQCCKKLFWTIQIIDKSSCVWCINYYAWEKLYKQSFHAREVEVHYFSPFLSRVLPFYFWNTIIAPNGWFDHFFKIKGWLNHPTDYGSNLASHSFDFGGSRLSHLLIIIFKFNFFLRLNGVS